MHTLHLGDCLELLPTLTGIDAVVTDPPYGMDWDADTTRFVGGRGQGRYGQGRKEKPIEGDREPFDPSPWLAFPKVVMWGFNHYAARLPVGTTLAWVKKNDDAFGKFLSDAELAWMKGGHGVYLHKDLSMNSVASSRVHPSQKPVGLMKWCIRKLNLEPGATVLDPYMGSGTTGVACLKMGLNFVGCEIDPGYFAVAKRRIAEAETPLFA